MIWYKSDKFLQYLYSYSAKQNVKLFNFKYISKP